MFAAIFGTKKLCLQLFWGRKNCVLRWNLSDLGCRICFSRCLALFLGWKKTRKRGKRKEKGKRERIEGRREEGKKRRKERREGRGERERKREKEREGKEKRKEKGKKRRKERREGRGEREREGGKGEKRWKLGEKGYVM